MENTFTVMQSSETELLSDEAKDETCFQQSPDWEPNPRPEVGEDDTRQGMIIITHLSISNNPRSTI